MSSLFSKSLCHLDVKLDNILVFKSDFSWVKLCDFGSVRAQGDIVIKKNELLPYCPSELVAKHANEYYQVDRVQDVFQFGIVVFFCLFGILPWQRADVTDPNFAHFCAWRTKKTSKPPKSFKPMTSRAQKMFRKLMDIDPAKRLLLTELGEIHFLPKVRIGLGSLAPRRSIRAAPPLPSCSINFKEANLPTGKYTEDRWLKKTNGRSVVGDALGAVGIGSDLLHTRGNGGSMINVNGM